MALYRDIIFPKYYDLIVRSTGYDERRANFLAGAAGRILEVGLGTGINLEYYPKNITEISAVEPLTAMKKRMDERLESVNRDRAPERKLTVDWHLGEAEHLPFAGAFFDTVVSTFTMCTIPNKQKALSEIRRVLKPGGKFLFLEHGLSWEPGSARVQKILDPVWKYIGCGCRLTIDAEQEIKNADFKIAALKKYVLPESPKFLGFAYEGVATP